jgi:hypothetical protein
METTYLRRYIREYLQPHKNLVKRTYCAALKRTVFKEINTPEFHHKILASTYSITFNLFRDILNGTPLRYIEVMMINLEESYNNPNIRFNDDLADFPQGLIQRYSLLFKVMAGFVPDYSSELKTYQAIIQEMEYLESQIEKKIREKDSKMQSRVYQDLNYNIKIEN